MGRPSKFDETRRRTVLEALRLGLSYETAAKLAGVSKVTLWSWRQEHEDFAEECESEIGRCEEDAAKLVKSAGATDPKWAAWYLERRFPKTWGNLRPEVLAARVMATEAPEASTTDDVPNDELVEAAKGK